ncbi:MAG: hypothetical protein ABI232_05580 [Jatrophihabitantaceae bacterium]
MKLSFLVGGAVGYVLGAKAGRTRYETIVRVGRMVAGSQTVQSTAGVLQGQLDTFGHHARHAVIAKLRAGGATTNGTAPNGANGYRR